MAFKVKIVDILNGKSQAWSVNRGSAEIKQRRRTIYIILLLFKHLMSRDESIVRLDLIFDESEHIANNNKRIGIELLDN